MDSFSTRICQAMKIRNMKQIELSMKTGILKGAISQYCSGAARPTEKRLTLVAQALQVSDEWLRGFDVPMDRRPFSDDFPDVTDLDIITVEQYLLQHCQPRRSER